MSELNQRWQTYKSKVIPRDAPAIQMVECKRAFFAGAGAVLEIVSRPQPDAASMLSCTRAVEGMTAEHRQFRLDVAADRA